MVVCVALRLVEGDGFAERMRARIRSAFRSWGGADLVLLHLFYPAVSTLGRRPLRAPRLP